MQYRRAFTPGGTFFFTLVTQDRRPVFASAEAVETLRGAFRAVRASRPFSIDAMVVMPDHLHCLWTLPPGDADFAHHADYIHYNPVKHGLAESPRDWPYSSFQRHVQAGVYPANWGENVIEFNGIGHE